jgi:hypothetical protein
MNKIFHFIDGVCLLFIAIVQLSPFELGMRTKTSSTLRLYIILSPFYSWPFKIPTRSPFVYIRNVGRLNSFCIFSITILCQYIQAQNKSILKPFNRTAEIIPLTYLVNKVMAIFCKILINYVSDIWQLQIVTNTPIMKLAPYMAAVSKRDTFNRSCRTLKTGD